ncbi:PREDICTED: serpin B12 isoform X2 [Condylura cristata]|uniref:serpin B12 isoform X2 n=1 Tax=Condylura cristata TaxID=143302 RepID=UPI000643E51C|nr:PREDICTED: serpin B12 isoform X2 [Condylura cristata]
MESLVAANTKFCFDFFQEISKTHFNKNVFYSPLSLSAAIAMVRLGAKSDSAQQIDQVLHFDEFSQNQGDERDPCLKSRTQETLPSNPESELLSCHFGHLLSKLDRMRADCTLSIANRLYGEKEFPICPEYSESVVQFYHTTIESVDFRKDTEKSRQAINFWVESQSRGKIKELFSKDTLTDDTVLVLVNAVYFKAKWEKYFDSENTVDAPFLLSENESKTVKMMHLKGPFSLGFIEELKTQILEMRYTKGMLSMFILLPACSEDNLKGLEELEKNITYEKIMTWSCSENMPEENVAVSFPQLTLEDSYDLNTVLQHMGITAVFDETKADLSGISPDPNLYLSKVIHKTFLEVDENGSEAVAASGIEAATKSATSWQTFNANHPFVFFIRHNPTQTVLFYGRVVSP